MTNEKASNSNGNNITDLCDVSSSPPIRRRIGAQPRRCVALKQQQVKGVGTLEEAKKFIRNPERSQGVRNCVKQRLVDCTDYSLPAGNISRLEQLHEPQDCTLSLNSIQTEHVDKRDYSSPGDVVRPELVEPTFPTNNVNKRKLIEDSFYFFPSGQIIGLDEPIDFSVKRSKLIDMTKESFSSGNDTKLDCSLPVRTTVKRKLIDDSFYFSSSGDTVGQVEQTDFALDSELSMKNKLQKTLKPRDDPVQTKNVKPTKKSVNKRGLRFKNVRTVPSREVVEQRQSDCHFNFYNLDLI